MRLRVQAPTELVYIYIYIHIQIYTYVYIYRGSLGSLGREYSTQQG